MRSAFSAVVVGLVVLSAVAAAPAAGTAIPAADATTDRSPNTSHAATADALAQSGEACEALSTGSAPDDPETDRLGWENGCWYNESLTLTASDGLNQTELDAVVARSMARVEQARELEFEKTVPVEILATEEYRREIANVTGNVTTEDRLHQNAKFEALFILNESEDAITAQQSSLANGTLGFYDPESEKIRIISSDPSSVEVPELTLGHELVHALQDQHFNTSYNRSTTDGAHGSNGVIEGDADFTEARYSDRCDADWNCSSLSAGGGGGEVNVGLQVNQLVPYSEGSEFIESRFERGGWAAVNELYDSPPATAEQVIHPKKYPDEQPERLRINHSASNGWGVLELPDGIDYATFGEGSIYTMMWYASYQKSTESGAPETVVVPYTHLFDYQPGTEQPDVGPYNYSHPITDGWDGDRLVPYVNEESNETGETGYVWKINWDTEADAEEFHEAYLELIEYHGAEPVAGHERTYRIPEEDENGFGDAFYITRDQDEVIVVNAPGVEELSQVRAGAAPAVESTATATGTPATDEPTATETPEPDESTETATATEEPMPDDGGADDSDGDSTDDRMETTASASGPGFGVTAALVALALAGLALRRRE